MQYAKQQKERMRLIDMDGNWYKNLECERIATVYGFLFYAYFR